MDWNKNRKDVREAPEETSDRIFGIMKPRKPSLSISHGETEPVNNIYLYEQAEKILREIEIEKGWAMEFVRKFQNR
jgi:hypothetical protein